ncbi:unnamed protein product [Phyllotreta striolata]|uniref:Transcription termination factor 5, mitochondrial n=1 Tax=Phyllotreta striolata TaxID=444603 RepID=A0A9N9XJ10_PHYSR|nr:unnamed protein product [Phyllotreta striolata]
MLRFYFILENRFKNIKQYKTLCYNTNTNVNSQILTDLLGISHKEAKLYIDKYKLFNKDGELLTQNIRICQSIGYRNKDILNSRSLLSVHPTELEQHYKALEEGGFSNITAHVLAKARTFMRRLIMELKGINLIPYSLNVSENLVSFIEDKNIVTRMKTDYSDEILWKDVHLAVLKNYLMLRLDGTEEEIEKLLRIHTFVRNKSFRVIQKNIKIAEELGFGARKIIKHGYLLANCPSYTETTLRDLGDLAGMNMRQAMWQYPKLIMTPPRNIIKIYGILKEFDISDEIIRKQPNVFHMSPETVKLRLQEIEKCPDMKILFQHPKFLALVVHHNRAKTRLDFLQQSQLRCATLSILKTNVRYEYEEYVKEGKDVNKVSDLLHYLERLFSITRHELKKKISRHPYYLQVPLKDMQTTYDYLLMNRFSKESIYKIVYILLYPIDKVEKAHDELRNSSNYNYKSLSQINKLNLMLYFMEKEYHFTGNGIWKNDKKPEYTEKSI